MSFIKPSLNIVATILAKDEEDIIGLQIEHHINQGISKIIFTDNGSTDKTKEIVSKYPEVVEIIDEPETDHNQSKWVTRMAQMACKLKPDWIIHLDADEFWCDLWALKRVDSEVVGCEGVYMHPPVGDFDFQAMRYYLDFDQISIPQECKIAHRPNPDIIVTHGNHGIEGNRQTTFTKNVHRHHYPIRSFEQWRRKAINGHEALEKRNSICKRWQRWAETKNPLEMYQKVCNIWTELIKSEQGCFLPLLEWWCEPELVELFKANDHWIPKVKEWKNPD